jgi:hypothetical protein
MTPFSTQNFVRALGRRYSPSFLSSCAREKRTKDRELRTEEGLDSSPSSVLSPPSFFRVAVSSLTFDHTNPRMAPLKPECHNSFDGDIGFQMIYGKRRTIGLADLLTLSATLCQLFDR